MNNPIPTLQSFADNVFKRYQKWWDLYMNEFLGKTIQIGKETLPLLQREYVLSKGLLSQANSITIPCIEIDLFYRIAKDGILFVNCNPSGTDYNYYQGSNTNLPTDFFFYSKPDNPYFNASDEFAKAAGAQNNYAIINTFPIVLKEQAVLKKAVYDAYNYNNSRIPAFDELFDILLDTIVKIQPRVVVATNAFVKDLFINKISPLHQKIKCRPNKDPDKICYDIEIGAFKTTLFCGGMIAGGHQMDTESKKRLIRDVKCFLKHSSIRF